MNDKTEPRAGAAGTPPADAVIADLIAQLDEGRVFTGSAVADRNTADWSDAPAAVPVALVMPRTPAEVATALRVCHRHEWPVSVQGGLTGLAGGANAQDGEIALSLSRLDAIEDVDTMGGTAIVQAGVTLEALQTLTSAHGWFLPLDLGARGSCQLGGNAATNAGGNRVLRYGMMRDMVLGLEVALADGTLLTMLDRVIKNNAGFDLKHLFIGTEGTLGVITRLSLALAPQPVERCTVLCAVEQFDAALTLLRHAKSALPELSAFELMWDDFLEASAQALQRPLPFGRPLPLYVLIEVLGGAESGSLAVIERMLEKMMEDGVIVDAIVAQSGAQVDQLWAYRESVSELLSLTKPCAAFDVSVAAPRMNELVAALKSALAREFPAQRHLFFGHLGDGNLHLISGPYADHAERQLVEELVYGWVGNFGGSISAEHGIGVVKRPFLHHSRGAEEIGLMRQLKGLLDPRHILNRDRIFA